LDEATATLNALGAQAQTAMEAVKEAMKDVDMKDVQMMAMEGMVSGLVNGLMEYPDLSQEAREKLATIVTKSAEEAKDGLPDFKTLILTAIPTFEDMDKEIQQMYIEQIKEAMKAGVNKKFDEYTTQLPQYVKDMLMMGMDHMLDMLEQDERQDWNNNQGGHGQYPNQGGNYNQGGYNQGGYNQGGYNQGGYNQRPQKPIEMPDAPKLFEDMDHIMKEMPDLK
jgi:hypothetical protein